MDYYEIIAEEAQRLREENPSISKGSGRDHSNYGNKRQESSYGDRYSRNESYGRSNRDEDDRYGRSRYDDKPSRNDKYGGGGGGGGGYGSRNYDGNDDKYDKGASKWTTAEPETSGSKWTESDPSSGGGERYGGSSNRSNYDGDRKYGRNDYERRDSYDRPSRGADEGGYRSYDRGNRQDDHQASKWTQGFSDDRENSYPKKNNYGADRYSRDGGGGRNRDDHYQSSKWTQGGSDDRENYGAQKNDYYGADRYSRDGGGGRNKDDHYQSSKWTQGGAKKDDYYGSSSGGYGRNADDNHQTSKWTQGGSDDHENSDAKKDDYYGSSPGGHGRNADDNHQTSKWTQGDPEAYEDSYDDSKKNDYCESDRSSRGGYGRNEDSNRRNTDDHQASKWTKNDPEEPGSKDDYGGSDRSFQRNANEDSNRRYSGSPYGHDDRTRNNYENNNDTKQRKNGYNFDDCDLSKPPVDDHEDPPAKACSTNAEATYYSNSSNNSLKPLIDKKDNYSPSQSSIADDGARKKSLSQVSIDRISNYSASKDLDGNIVDFDRFLIDYKPSNRVKTNHCVLDLTNDNHYDRLKQILQAASMENVIMIIQIDDQKASEIAAAMQAEGIWVFNLSKDDKNIEQTSKQHSSLRTPVVTYSFLVNNPDVLKCPHVVVNYDFDWKRVKYLERYLRYRNENKESEAIIDIYHLALPETPNAEKLKSLFGD